MNYNYLKDKVIKMYVEENLSTREVGRKLSISDSTVIRLLQDSGIPRRTSKEGQHIKWPEGRFGKMAANWKGGRKFCYGKIKGYIHLYKPDHPYASKAGYVMEHRLVMEQKLGRYLEPTEIVHHINGKMTDNRPENLEVISRSVHVHNHFATGRSMMELEAENKRLEEENKNLKTEIDLLKSKLS